MVQINLLPDIKKEFIKSQQTKKAVITFSALLSIVMLVLTVLFFLYVQFGQALRLKSVQNDIDDNIKTIKRQNNAQKIITVQGTLANISGLQDKKAITTRLFDYVNGFTNKEVSYSSIKFDNSANTMTLSGNAESVEKINALANNLKSAEISYKQNGQPDKIKPFNTVKFTSLSNGGEGSDGKANFELSFTYDPIIFQQSLTDIKIKVDASSERLLSPTDQPFSDNVAAPSQQQGGAQ